MTRLRPRRMTFLSSLLCRAPTVRSSPATLLDSLWHSNQDPVQNPVILTYDIHLAFRLFAMINGVIQKRIIMAMAFFCSDETRGFMRNCSSTALIPSSRKGRVRSLSPRRLDILSLVAPAMVVLVLLDVIGCSSTPEQIDPDQMFQRSLDAFQDTARRYEEQQNWAGYAKAQNDLGVIYLLQAQRGIEPMQNLQLSLDALEKAARRHEEQQNWAEYTSTQNNLGVTYMVLAQHGSRPARNLQRSLDVLKEAARRDEEQQNWAGYAATLNNLGVTYRVLAQSDIEPAQNLQRSFEALKEVARWFEEEQNWGGYAEVQNNLGLNYRIQADRNVELEQNLQRSLDAFKEAARRFMQHK